MYSLNAFITVQLTQSCDKQFHLSTIRLLKVYFLKPSLLRFLNNLPDCPLLLPLSNSKNKSILYQLYLFHPLLSIADPLLQYSADVRLMPTFHYDGFATTVIKL